MLSHLVFVVAQSKHFKNIVLDWKQKNKLDIFLIFVVLFYGKIATWVMAEPVVVFGPLNMVLVKV